MTVHVQRERPSRRPAERDILGQILSQRYRRDRSVIRRCIQSSLQRVVVVDVVVRDDRFHAAGALAVFKGVHVLFDHYPGQGCFCAVLHVAGVVLVNESAILRQQQHKRLRRVCVVVRNLLERAAADGDGSAVNKLHVFKGTARNTQRAAGIDRPSTPVIETVLDGDGCTL